MPHLFQATQNRSPSVHFFVGSIGGNRARERHPHHGVQFHSIGQAACANLRKEDCLINGNELAQLVIDHGVGVTDVASYTINKIDIDYFGEG